MLAKPCPTELTAPINPDRGVEGHRNLFCTFYDGCLDEAVKTAWNSWTCTRCELHGIEPEVEGGLESYAPSSGSPIARIVASAALRHSV